MEFDYVDIRNFKGIEHVRLDFAQSPKQNVYTLVGLNESGKTTILEALNLFGYGTEKLGPLNLYGYDIGDLHDLIPVSKRDNFNDDITISFGLRLDASDEEKVSLFMKRNHKFTIKEKIRAFSITRTMTFKNSEFLPDRSVMLWEIDVVGRKYRGRKVIRLESSDVEWDSCAEFIKKRIPSILFFPNFFSDFPTRIYLEDYGDNDDLHEFYRSVLQDILNSLGTGANLTTHVLKRAKSAQTRDLRSLDAQLARMSSHITNVILKKWSRIFSRTLDDKEIVLRCQSDEHGDKTRYYIEFQLKESDQLYLIRERSLGFRWFFAFFLLTHYWRFRSDSATKALFLFDEPASNLHPSAQHQLLRSLGKLAENCKIVYTTHSHHLIDPNWLEGAYVVKNEGIDYGENIESYNSRKTRITVDRYRSFAVKHPDQTTYFQPILDVLDYAPSKLESVPRVVIVEGKNDYITLEYFAKVVLGLDTTYGLMPGCGAGGLDTVIRLYLGWSRDFMVLLDADSEGAKQKKRYIEQYGNGIEGRIATLEDINSKWTKRSTEGLFAEADRLSIQNLVDPKSKRFNKTHFNRSVQELLARNKPFSFDEETVENFRQVLEFFEGRLGK